MMKKSACECGLFCLLRINTLEKQDQGLFSPFEGKKVLFVCSEHTNCDIK